MIRRIGKTKTSTFVDSQGHLEAGEWTRVDLPQTRSSLGANMKAATIITTLALLMPMTSIGGSIESADLLPGETATRASVICTLWPVMWLCKK